MELYVLDSLLRRVAVVDTYKSLIWTERFQSEGDFELVLQSTLENRSLFTPDTWLAVNVSYRCMIVKTVEDTTNDEGERLLTVKGPSIESILDDRVAFNFLDDLTAHPSWTITDAPADVMRKVFTDICVTGILDPTDVIPFITNVAILPDDSIPEPTGDITVDILPQTVLSLLKYLAVPYDLGFRLIRNFDLSQLVFDVYAGSDHTSQQTTLPPVIFSEGLENLKNTTTLTSSEGLKNVAYVFSTLGYETVVAADVDPDISGFEKKILVVDATDITETDLPTLSALLIQRGKEELAQHRGYGAFDGEVSQTSQYVYGTDYQLGDLVETRNDDGATNIMRVTEQIFVDDSEGERSYPTLTVQQFITPGSWGSWPNVVWLDYDSELTYYWEDAP